MKNREDNGRLLMKSLSQFTKGNDFSLASFLMRNLLVSRKLKEFCSALALAPPKAECCGAFICPFLKENL